MKKSIQNVLAILEILLIWGLGALILNRPVLPGPVETFRALFGFLGEKAAYEHIGASLFRVLAGTVIGIAAAIPAGLLLGYGKRWNMIFGKAFDFLYMVPKIVFLPVILVLLGIGDVPKIFLIALVLFFQQAVVIRDSARSIRQEVKKTIRSLNAGPLQTMVHVLLPCCLPEIMTSLRATLGTSFALLFITESFAAERGLGYFITKCMNQRDYPLMYASIVLLAGSGCLLYYLIGVIERRLCPWKFLKN